jgi:hypothetical protein
MEIEMNKFTLAMALALLSGPALAERVEVLCQETVPFTANAMMCTTRGTTSFQSDGTNVPFYMTLKAPLSHCSDVSYRIFRPGEDRDIGFTRRLAPGQSQAVEIGSGFGPGITYVEIAAVGYVHGCNVGQIHSWAVEVSAAPVP